MKARKTRHPVRDDGLGGWGESELAQDHPIDRIADEGHNRQKDESAQARGAGLEAIWWWFLAHGFSIMFLIIWLKESHFFSKREMRTSRRVVSGHGAA